MADKGTAREAKLSQYLLEAYGKEKELEVSLEAHIGMTTRAPYKKRLKEHLKETKSHSKQLERRIKKVNADAATTIAKAGSQANKLMAAAKGPLHALRGNSETEKMLKNAKTEYFQEHEEIATYTAIEILANELDDPETAKMAKAIRRDEERMASFLEKQIPVLTRQMVKEDIPAAERKAPAAKKPAAKKSAAKKPTAAKSTAKKPAASKSTAKKSTASKSAAKKAPAKKRTPAKRTKAAK
ncbi:MAG: ferritin-like domain-containing protein [Actinomycetota bacterium]|nr:ferritin-like domain-containing protein [Actinomycetota bacterium]